MNVRRMIPAVLLWLATSPVAAWAQGGERAAEGGGGLFEINTGLSVWTVLVFLGLVLILGKFAWGPILAAVEAREQGIQNALDEAARSNEEAARILEEHRRQLAEARRRAGELLTQGKQAGEKLRREIEEKARAEAQGIVERARADIQRERDKALDALRRESVDLALAAASRLIHERLDQAHDRKLVETYLHELSSGEGAEA